MTYKVGDKVQYMGYEATIEAIDYEEHASQFRLGSMQELPGVVVFCHPRHPGWGFSGTPEEWEVSPESRSELYANWPSTFDE